MLKGRVHMRQVNTEKHLLWHLKCKQLQKQKKYDG